jgi:putative NADH-flavin reductase
MRIALFGATGGTGRAVIDRALQAGHQVKALARQADKLLPRDGLTVVQGDAMVAEDVARTMADSDAVVVALGNSQNAFALLFGARRTTPRDICEAGTRNILAALGDGDDRSVIVVSAFGVGATRDKLPLMFKLFYRLVLREQIADKERQEALLRASNANYIVIQPVALTDKPASGKWTATLDGTLGGSEVSRHDLAAVVLSELTAKTHTRQTISLSG